MSQATEAFIDQLIGAVPQLQPLREKHVEENFGELVPDVLMGEITAEAVELYARGDQSTVRRLLEFLETEAEAGHEGDVDELIAVSFVENPALRRRTRPRDHGRARPAALGNPAVTAAAVAPTRGGERPAHRPAGHQARFGVAPRSMGRRPGRGPRLRKYDGVLKARDAR